MIAAGRYCLSLSLCYYAQFVGMVGDCLIEIGTPQSLSDNRGHIFEGSHGYYNAGIDVIYRRMGGDPGTE